MEGLKIPDVGMKIPKKSKKTLILGAVAATLLAVMIVLGATSNYFGATVSSKVVVSLASSPVSDTVSGGDTAVPLVGFTFMANTLKTVMLQDVALYGYIDDENGGASYETGISTDSGALGIYDVITSVWAKDGSGNVLGSASTFDSTGKVSLTGLNLSLVKGATQTIIFYGDVSSSAGYNSVADRVAVDIASKSDVLVKNMTGSKTIPVVLSTRNYGSSSPVVYLEVPVTVSAAPVFSIDDVCSDYEVYSEDNTFCFDNNCHYDSDGETYCISDYCNDTTPYFTRSYDRFYCDTDTCTYDLSNPGEYTSVGCTYDNYEFWSDYCTRYSSISEDSIYCRGDECTYYSDGTSDCYYEWMVAYCPTYGSSSSDYMTYSNTYETLEGHCYTTDSTCTYYEDGTTPYCYSTSTGSTGTGSTGTGSTDTGSSGTGSTGTGS